MEMFAHIGGLFFFGLLGIWAWVGLEDMLQSLAAYRKSIAPSARPLRPRKAVCCTKAKYAPYRIA
ncbi:hypothetical protein GCM10007972_18940 [Iodidimonas muriae]|uniref:Uncharacterized protein n=1 Tax=Iodidimonas muriae TaxID=261467 RepID=A0ABQ2LE67_9PROT|nr:hypothetical protein JCM17843_13870 [Kordiimonadales bacterium JCM 17843]GGO13098.1 hypothetical protein GCM10007972_18940 [Iodidimonas muriae]